MSGAINNMTKEEFLKQLGSNIRYYRELHHWSQEELGNKCGYKTEHARSTISKIETGHADVPASKIILLAKVFGIGPEKLLSVSGNTKNNKVSASGYDSTTYKMVNNYLKLNSANQQVVDMLINDMLVVSKEGNAV